MKGEESKIKANKQTLQGSSLRKGVMFDENNRKIEISEEIAKGNENEQKDHLGQGYVEIGSEYIREIGENNNKIENELLGSIYESIIKEEAPEANEQASQGSSVKNMVVFGGDLLKDGKRVQYDMLEGMKLSESTYVDKQDLRGSSLRKGVMFDENNRKIEISEEIAKGDEKEQKDHLGQGNVEIGNEYIREIGENNNKNELRQNVFWKNDEKKVEPFNKIVKRKKLKIKTSKKKLSNLKNLVSGVQKGG